MTVDRIFKQSGMGSSDRLDLLESIWIAGGYPDIAYHLRQTLPSRPDLRSSLVELDLEYRWKRYRKDASFSQRDPFGFPLFPRLDDYAALFSDGERSQILNPRLLAEEYRVRRFWGDQPPREEFLHRIPDQSPAVEEALNRIDTEFRVEGMTPLDEDSQSPQDSESTILNQTQPAESEPMTPSPNIGKYELREFLGRGGFGEVWKAYDPNLKRYVALKFPRPDKKFSSELLENIRREAQKMAALEQVPGIVPVYEAGESNGVPYLVSFYVAGSDLGVRFKEGSLALEDSIRIVAEVAETLHRAHLNHLFHRDVKLSNILINREGRAFLSDFGLCVSEEEQLHEPHSATGTYAYMSPEQIRGNSHQVDGRADIYSLGVVLYRLLTRRLPYVAENPTDYMNQVLTREPRPPRSIDDQIPVELERICLKCLRKSISDRYTTASDLAAELRAWISGARPTAPSGGPLAEVAASSKPVQPSKHVALAGIFAVSCIIMSGIALSYFWPPGDSAPVSPVVDDDPVSTAGVNAMVGVTKATPSALKGENVLVLKDVSEYLSQQGLWDVREEDNVVRVIADELTMKWFGNTQRLAGRTFSFQVQELKVGTTLGFFFAMSGTSFNSHDASWKMLLVERIDRQSYRVSLQHRRHAGRRIVRRDIKPLGHRELDLSSLQLSIELSFSETDLSRIKINGKNYLDLITEYQERDTSDDSRIGRCGFHCLRGSGVFSNPVIDQTAQLFRD